MSGQEPSREQHVVDCETLSPTQLRLKYRSEYRSWDNMKQRCRLEGGVLDPAFAEWRAFLRYMGPKPGASHSVDRIDHQNPTYGPGLVRWATKAEQANNRRTTVFVEYDGQLIPQTEAARREGITPGAMRKRRQRAKARGEVTAAAPVNYRQRSVAAKWPGEQTPERLAGLERLYLNRGPSLEGETRAAFFIGLAHLEIGKRRANIETSAAMVSFLEHGALPLGHTPHDMEAILQDDFRSQSVEEISVGIAADKATVQRLEGLIEEARMMLPTSTYSRPRRA